MAVDRKKIAAAEKRLNWKNLKDVEKFFTLVIEQGAWNSDWGQSMTMKLLAFEHSEKTVSTLMIKVDKLIEANA